MARGRTRYRRPLVSPDDVLDMGNSGTAARLLCGILASHDIFSVMTGDASLRQTADAARHRAVEGLRGPLFSPVRAIVCRSPFKAPGMRLPISYRLPVASAQVKSAILLAGLNARGITEVEEPDATRDHSGKHAPPFRRHGHGQPARRYSRHIQLDGQPELRAADITVPGDPIVSRLPAGRGLAGPGFPYHAERHRP